MKRPGLHGGGELGLNGEAQHGGDVLSFSKECLGWFLQLSKCYAFPVECWAKAMPPFVRRRRPQGARPQETEGCLALLGHPGYYACRLDKVKRISPHASDRNRQPFLVDWGLRKWLHKSGRWANKDLTLRPKRGKKRKNGQHRWDLACTIGKKKSVYFHRVLGLSIWPCVHDEEGWGVEPFCITSAWAAWYEVHHGDDDSRNSTGDNLFVLWWLYHRTLRRS